MEIITPSMQKMPVHVWEWTDVFAELAEKYPHRVVDFAQSFSENQFAAKKKSVRMSQVQFIGQLVRLKIWQLKRKTK